MKIRRTLAATGTAVVLSASLAVPAAATSQRMELECTHGTLAGHVIERSNGANWWDQADGTVYTTHYLRISSGDEPVYEKAYGVKSGPIETCTGDHFDFTWYVEVVASARQ